MAPDKLETCSQCGAEEFSDEGGTYDDDGVFLCGACTEQWLEDNLLPVQPGGCETP